MKKKKIFIYDDDQKLAKKLEQDLENLEGVKKHFEIEALNENKFKNIVAVFEKRRRSVREKEEWEGESIALDEASIFIIDYDLFESNRFLTGEEVSYLARCFSNCGVIVALNQFYEVDFDLTLKGHLESYADLNLRGDQLCNPNLWGGKGEEFHPWYWPVLTQLVDQFSKRVKDVKENIGKPICKALGFKPEEFDFQLPRSVSQFLGPEPKNTTFRDFVKSSGNGMHHLDSEKAHDDIVARVAAARISKWLERSVLPEMDILVDAPHLVSRFPSLLLDAKEKIENWNATAKRAKFSEIGIDFEKIEKYRFKKEYWSSRPVWFWNRMREDSAILEVKEPWKTIRPKWVFCEDISRFHEGKYKEFVARVESPFGRRFVKGINGIKYQPRVRFSL